MKPDNRIKKRRTLLVVCGALVVTAAVTAMVVIGMLPRLQRQTGTTEPTARGPTSSDIYCRRAAILSGQFVEDGSDMPVDGVASILVTNLSDQFLDLATMTYDIDGREATFVVTGLPAGSSAWVMESSAMTANEDSAFDYVDCVASFRENTVAHTDKISLYANGTTLTAVNNTDETLENVFIYYKTLHTDGNFYGGITYSVNFGTLEPGGSAQSIAGHYTEDATRIVRIGWQEGSS